MIICSDFDGTIFFRDDNVKTERNLAAINQWRTAGNIFVVATNRNFNSLHETLPSHPDYFDYLILDNGATLLDNSNHIVHSAVFAGDEITELTQLMNDLNDKPRVTYFSTFSNDSETPVENTTKIRFWLGSYGQGERLLPKIANLHPATLMHYDRPGFEQYRAIIDVGQGKEVAISKLLEYTQEARDNIVTIGDGMNDLEMLEKFNGYAITGSAAAEALPELRTVSSVAELVEILQG